MNYNIEGKVAVVTGSGQGIGRETALKLAGEGAKVCVNCLDVQHGHEVVETIERFGGKAVFIRADVSDEEDVKNLFEQAASRLGTVDILVNNAAISPKVPFEDISAEDFDKVLRINLTGSFLCCQQAFLQMKTKNWGRIVSVSSSAARFGTSKAGVHYAASKAGILAMTLTLAKKMGPYHITVNCVVPSRINTALTKVLPPQDVAAMAAQIPLGRIGEPGEVAAVIAFLASDKASYITGACMDIRGGNPA